MIAGRLIWRTMHVGVKLDVVLRRSQLWLIHACNCIDLVEPIPAGFRNNKVAIVDRTSGSNVIIAKTNMASILKNENDHHMQRKYEDKN